MIATTDPYFALPFAAMAHRGGSTWEPNIGKENTLAAFQAAVDLGYRYIETDVQATSDGQLVCFHDDTLERMTGTDKPVVELSGDDLRTLVTLSGEPIPFFDEVVEALPTTRFNVDLKTDQAVEPLIELIKAHRLQGRILVDSFYGPRLNRFRAQMGVEIPTAAAPGEVARVRFFGGVGPIPAMALQVPLTHQFGPFTATIVTPATIARVHRLGKVIHVWTIDDVPEMERLIDMGVDGLVTDRPDLLKEVLIRRGLWQLQEG